MKKTTFLSMIMCFLFVFNIQAQGETEYGTQSMYAGLTTDMFNTTNGDVAEAKTAIGVSFDWTHQADAFAIELSGRAKFSLDARAQATALFDVVKVFSQEQPVKLEIGYGVLFETDERLSGSPICGRATLFVKKWRIRGEISRNVLRDKAGGTPILYTASVAYRLW